MDKEHDKIAAATELEILRVQQDVLQRVNPWGFQEQEYAMKAAYYYNGVHAMTKALINRIKADDGNYPNCGAKKEEEA